MGLLTPEERRKRIIEGMKIHWKNRKQSEMQSTSSALDNCNAVDATSPLATQLILDMARTVEQELSQGTTTLSRSADLAMMNNTELASCHSGAEKMVRDELGNWLMTCIE